MKWHIPDRFYIKSHTPTPSPGVQYYYVINQVISYWLSYRSEVSCIGQRPKAEDLYS